MKTYVYALLTVMSLTSAIRTDSFIVAVCASMSAAGFGIWTLQEIVADRKDGDR